VCRESTRNAIEFGGEDRRCDTKKKKGRGYDHLSVAKGRHRHSLKGGKKGELKKGAGKREIGGLGIQNGKTGRD